MVKRNAANAPVGIARCSRDGNAIAFSKRSGGIGYRNLKRPGWIVQGDYQPSDVTCSICIHYFKTKSIGADGRVWGEGKTAFDRVIVTIERLAVRPNRRKDARVAFFVARTQVADIGPTQVASEITEKTSELDGISYKVITTTRTRVVSGGGKVDGVTPINRIINRERLSGTGQ